MPGASPSKEKRSTDDGCPGSPPGQPPAKRPKSSPQPASCIGIAENGPASQNEAQIQSSGADQQIDIEIASHLAAAGQPSAAVVGAGQQPGSSSKRAASHPLAPVAAATDQPGAPAPALAAAAEHKWVVQPGAASRRAGAAQPPAAAETERQRGMQLLEALAGFQEQQQQRQLFMEVDVSAEVEPQALVGRMLRVLWPDDDAWYLGRVVSYDPTTGRHEVDYADGDHGSELFALERARLLMYAGEVLPAPSPESLTEQAGLLLRLADGEKGKGKSAGPLRAKAQHLMDLADRRRAAQQAQQEAQQQPCPPLAKQARGEPQRAGEQGGQQAQQAPSSQQEGSQEQQAEEAAAHMQQRPAEGALLPGEVVWARVSGYRDWPAIVITREEALARGATSGQARAPHNTPVLFFGTAEVGCLRQTVITRFGQGVGRGFHCPKAARKEQAFRRSLCEVETYLRTGELPASMLPDHNDGHGSSDGEDEEESAPASRRGVRAKGSKKQAKGLVGGSEGEAAGVKVPFQANKHVTVLSLGRIEFIHPGFHDEKHIWPVGYRAQRVVATPASKGREVPHVCEVLEMSDGSGPLFRVTPQGGQAAEGPSATLAWQALYAADSHGRVRSMGISGPTMFGLAAPRVQAAIQRLPGAERCERYCGWPEGEQPEVPPLTAAQQRARLACTARMQKLPLEVRPVPRDLPWAPAASSGAAPAAANSTHAQCGQQQGTRRAQQAQRGQLGQQQQLGVGTCRQAACEICMSEEEVGDDLIVQCDGCLALVHMSCYGVETHPHGDRWLCHVCSLGLEKPPACVLCPVVGGVMKPTACGRWCHSACGLWTEETRLDPERGVIRGVQEVKGARLKLSCQICRQQYGSCVQCAGSKKCYAAFHPLCAWGAGYTMELVQDFDSDSESEDDSGDENDSGAPNRQSSRSARRPNAKEGTGLGSGMRLTAYCPKHPPLLPGRGVSPLRPQPSRADSTRADSAAAITGVEGPGGSAMPGGAGAAGACGGLTGTQPPPAPLLRPLRPQGGSSSLIREASKAALAPATAAGGDGAASRGGQEGQRLARTASMSETPWDNDCSGAAAAAAVGPGGDSCFAGRGPSPVLPALEALRGVPLGAGRGREEGRAGAAIAGAGKEALAVAAPSPEGFPGCARAAPFNHAARRGQRAPEAIAAAEAKRLFVQSLPYLVGGPRQQPPQQVPPSACRPPPPEQQQPPQQQWGRQSQLPPERQAGGVTGEGGILPASSQQDQEQQQQGNGQAGAGAPSTTEERDCQRAPPALRPNGERILSQRERFAEMRRTVGQRLTIGKSGIHGWGAFAKQRHRAGDMVIEYAGEVVRHSVSDVRERRIYNELVGAGTYTFSLNEHLNVDATRAGNMAHILNHSCGPNCFSRTLSLKGADGRVADRVVIFALRDIEVGEELTYDYRFSGKEQLPCNCGAPCCRGLVNKRVKREGLWVPRYKLKPFLPKGASEGKITQ